VTLARKRSKGRVWPPSAHPRLPYADQGAQTLVLWGEDNPVSPVQWTSGFDRVFTELDLIFYPECGHFIVEEQPEAAAKDILHFARRVLSAT
jgi:pimeloyl-ACP methyl ester carboxylesterase